MIEVYRDAHDEDGVYLVYADGDNGIYHLPGSVFAELIEVDMVPGDAIPLIPREGGASA